MSRSRRNGYAGLPALLVAGAFLLPLLSRAVEWLGLPRELRIALPLVLGAAALAGVEGTRRASLERSETEAGPAARSTPAQREQDPASE